ncbi:hypothetical protein BD293_4050 [Roseinatronobacter monicus]|uniref:Uncharacterized protein n=1 Tax=Roseinatronobacter monicus TaxID=393481 RepID=A0A543K4Z4_9RHOB|nr:hypothetical protein BD293_4050 [Roseinatronobacter monicus]
MAWIEPPRFSVHNTCARGRRNYITSVCTENTCAAAAGIGVSLLLSKRATRVADGRLIERTVAGRQINIAHARIDVCVSMSDAPKRINRSAGAYEPAGEVWFALAYSYAKAPNMHSITLTEKG